MKLICHNFLHLYTDLIIPLAEKKPESLMLTPQACNRSVLYSTDQLVLFKSGMGFFLTCGKLSLQDAQFYIDMPVNSPFYTDIVQYAMKTLLYIAFVYIH